MFCFITGKGPKNKEKGLNVFLIKALHLLPGSGGGGVQGGMGSREKQVICPVSLYCSPTPEN